VDRAARRSSTSDGSGSSYESTSDSIGGWRSLESDEQLFE